MIDLYGLYINNCGAFVAHIFSVLLGCLRVVCFFCFVLVEVGLCLSCVGCSFIVLVCYSGVCCARVYARY